MGSSARKKKEKKKDFQKQKLKVGKTKAKADNFTDTSFKSKAIVINQQSLSTTAPSSSSQFSHYLSLASSSKTDSQRRDALSYLTTQLSSQPVNDPMPLPTAILLPKLLPLILDGTSSVRSQLLKFLRLLPAADVGDRAEQALLYTRAGMTHLAAEIRVDALAVLEWMLEVSKDDVVTCPGGWVKTLKSFMTMMGWATSGGSTNWTSASKSSFGKFAFGKAGKAFPRQLLVLAQFLKAGLAEPEDLSPAGAGVGSFPLCNREMHMIPKRANAYAHLNLFGSSRDEEGEMYIDREDRQRVFQSKFRATVEEGISTAQKEAGEAGRAAAVLSKVLREGMTDYSGIDDIDDTQ
ncbi:pre-rRNA-processing protein-like protein ipi1 [Amylocarpus encephaloides]|uniref:Pre-rRNA-processing protein n=1 Tax=Amylocarpus encephaloides TaxID=45428 RepID=A0A9P7YQ18_9HELO|nr:pre-rRNA-processing protein-like protein ipi1 [Amylocarpus encephaloides]